MLGRGPRILICLLAALGAVSLSATAQAAGGKKLFGAVAAEYPSGAELQRVAAGGVRTLRVPLIWASVEPTPGAREWQALDALVADTAQANVQLLPFLFGTPSWLAADTSSPPIYSPEQRAAWASFVHDLSSRYGTTGTFWAQHPEVPRRPIVVWQVWNEVNLRFFWGAQPNPRKYADLVRLTRDALKVGDPAAQVLLAGLLPFKTTGAGSVAGGRYLKRLLKIPGLRKLFEGVAIHPYGKTPRIAFKSLQQTRMLLDRLGARRIPLWVTEFGWSTGGMGWSSSPFKATPARQASRIRTAYRLMVKARKSLRLRRAIYFSLADYDQAGIEDDWIARMGLFTVDGQPKPAWYAYSRVAGGRP